MTTTPKNTPQNNNLDRLNSEQRTLDLAVTDQETFDQLLQVSRQVAGIAQSIHRKIILYVILGAVGSGALVWQFYAVDNALWHNVILIVLLFLPALIWLIFLSLLSQVTDLPEQISEVVEQRAELGVISQQFTTQQKSEGLRALLSMFRRLKASGLLEEVLGATASLSLLANPLFLILLFISAIFLLLFSLAGVLMLLF